MELTNVPKKIVLISSGQPSLNPRLVKEADSLANAGYAVTVLYAYWNDWGTALDKTILPAKKWNAVRVGGDPQEKPVIFFLSRLIHRLSLLILKVTGIKYFAKFAIARSSFFLLRKARKYKADLYIGHNLGALPVVVKAAEIHKKPCGFDAEDFHRHEVSDDIDNFDVQLKINIEESYIHRLCYLTASSPGISAAYQQLFQDQAQTTILNVFPAGNQIAEPGLTADATLKLFWFSQTIGQGRGLNDCIKALHLLNNPNIELHLLGFVTDENRQQLTATARDSVKLIFYKPVPPDDIPVLASQFDIGLAPEDSIPLNRDICLTNKIFTYLQAGLAIIASDTTAQKQLLNKHPGIGKVYENGSVEMLAAAIQHYVDDRDDLYKTKKVSYAVARNELNWEKESEKFLKVISDTLSA